MGIPDTLAVKRGKGGEHRDEDVEMKAMAKAGTGGAYWSGRSISAARSRELELSSPLVLGGEDGGEEKCRGQ